MNGDTPIHRKTFLEMTDEEQVAFISALRERRLAPINTYNEVKEANRQKRIGKLNEKIEKELAQFEKSLAKVDKYLDELQDRSNKLRTLKIQLDLE